MKKIILFGLLLSVILFPSITMAFPSVYATGTTLYNPEKTWSGYTIYYALNTGAILIDMNGNIVRKWEGISTHPVKMMPGGFVMGPSGGKGRYWGVEGSGDLEVQDWDGKTVWKQTKSGVHHDFQREGNPVGYYAPKMDSSPTKGRTLILSHVKVTDLKISDKPLYEDYLVEVDENNKVVWEWKWHEHFDELDFDEAAKNALYRDPNMDAAEKAGDWLHINAASYVGPNKWYDAGDQRFHPENILWDARQANILGITDRKTGKIVWQVGPDYTKTAALRKLGQIIGQHHAHMIPKGLPGEGNVMVFDNGGKAGFGEPNPGSPNGQYNAVRDSSRVVEFNPVTLEKVWEYSSEKIGYRAKIEYPHMFYSPFISSAQRLPNGNTLITEGANGRIFEVTPKLEMVWEYVNPFWGASGAPQPWNMVYRAYRVPYEWVPQLQKPAEKAITPPDSSQIRVTADGKLEVIPLNPKTASKPAPVPTAPVAPAAPAAPAPAPAKPAEEGPGGLKAY